MSNREHIWIFSARCLYYHAPMISYINIRVIVNNSDVHRRKGPKNLVR